jgi:hypothetical protein
MRELFIQMLKIDNQAFQQNNLGFQNNPAADLNANNVGGQKQGVENPVNIDLGGLLQGAANGIGQNMDVNDMVALEQKQAANNPALVHQAPVRHERSADEQHEKVGSHDIVTNRPASIGSLLDKKRCRIT